MGNIISVLKDWNSNTDELCNIHKKLSLMYPQFNNIEVTPYDILLNYYKDDISIKFNFSSTHNKNFFDVRLPSDTSIYVNFLRIKILNNSNIELSLHNKFKLIEQFTFIINIRTENDILGSLLNGKEMDISECIDFSTELCINNLITENDIKIDIRTIILFVLIFKYFNEKNINLHVIRYDMTSEIYSNILKIFKKLQG